MYWELNNVSMNMNGQTYKPIEMDEVRLRDGDLGDTHDGQTTVMLQDFLTPC